MTQTLMIENAVVLAAGLGTRMRPITDTIPKPLVSVYGKPLLDHALDALESADVKRACINVHYLADQIEQHVESRPKPSCTISDERVELLDSGGGVKQACAAFEKGPFVILNADSFWMDGQCKNLEAMRSFWDEDRMDMLMLVSTKQDAVGFDGAGDFFMASDGQLARRGEAANAPFIYAGAIVAKTEAFAEITDRKFSLNKLFDDAIARGRLFGVVLDGLWLHVGTPDAIAEAESAISQYEQSQR